jgi:hypothetical protein
VEGGEVVAGVACEAEVAHFELWMRWGEWEKDVLGTCRFAGVAIVIDLGCGIDLSRVDRMVVDFDVVLY